MILDGKRTVITGAASGIGAGAAQVFAREGARVALLDRSIEQANELLADLPAVNAGDHIALEVDVASPDAIDKAFAIIDEQFGGVDGLANSAGVRGVENPLEVTLEDWKLHHDVNLTGTFYCAQHAARRMAAQGDGGSIVNIASVSGVLPNNRRTAYSSSKAGVIGLTKSLAADLGELGIRVNAICPGLTRTGLTEPYFRDNPDWVDDVSRGRIPLRRYAEPIEIAEAIAFLASDRASFITGVMLPVDGGQIACCYLGGDNTVFSQDREVV